MRNSKYPRENSKNMFCYVNHYMHGVFETNHVNVVVCCFHGAGTTHSFVLKRSCEQIKTLMIFRGEGKICIFLLSLQSSILGVSTCSLVVAF